MAKGTRWTENDLDNINAREEKVRENQLRDEVIDKRGVPITEKQRRIAFKKSMDDLLKKPKKRIAKHEEILSLKVCTYIKIKYPDAIFTCEASGIRVGKGAAIKMAKQRSGRGLPDLLLFEPRVIYGKQYSGLLIEMKKAGTKLLKLNGSLVADGHIREQLAIIERLNIKGYFARMCVGYDEVIQTIDEYMTS